MDRPAMASVFRMRHAPATVSGVRSTGQGQADPVIRVRSLGEAIRFVANAYPQYDIGAVAISCGDVSIGSLGNLEVKALWREYGERLTQE
ncbi:MULTISPECIES: hypothetical protein [unclassified Mesorhizobium]|uniref:hypothetical protein n=1 Tax=unclassified Mesorhizobium TaxID=325217 RepID=UPI000FCA3F42|nr:MULTISPECIES: hypothetical protein [unclassified Mesorhizobium]RUU80936.1 hypothetical protein EOC06_10340 [Mesorhizobium sp. M7A.F.Ca.MR.362.00.0.0]RUV16496.1 hypothetical protein EOB80_30900 [Mesorhizobium sp. M7A.F.Ca.MR.245.00.0.0]RUV50863.1 hypothetical protein EOB77_13410 [Mesorhizobium sp. M7A.F.Ca.MR.228.00.0.0]RWN91839.1 MAG: hypothetical protein EOS05_19020 [Mesorhizobium sp.]